MALGARPTARRSRRCSCTTPTARPCACRARRAARWAAASAPPARPGSTATSPPARSSSRWCGPAAGPATTAGGCRTWCSWAWASRWPTTTRRGPPSSGCTPTSGCRPATSRCRRSGSCPASAGWPTEALPVNLAVSLHAADDELRDELVPINRRYPLSTLMDACAGYLLAKGRRLSFEWALIDGVNDRRARRRAARRAVAEPPAARPREPHPAQPHAGLRGARLAGRAGARVPRRARGPAA